MESLFGSILLVCEELDLLGGTHFSLDGVKLTLHRFQGMEMNYAVFGFGLDLFGSFVNWLM